jgi:cobalt-zinc-cadmium efflux system outer membrane protein
VLCGALSLLTFVAASGETQVVDSTVPRASDRFLDARAGKSVEDLVSLALAQEPMLAAARLGVEAAQGRVRQARLRPNLAVSFFRQEEAGGTDNETSVAVDWPLDLYRRDARETAAARAVDGARYEAEDRARLLAADVRRRAGALLAAVRALRVTEDQLAAARRLSTLVAARVSEGAAPELEGSLVEVEVDRLTADLALAESRAEQALIALKRSLGASPEEVLFLKLDLEASVAFSRESDSTSLPAGSKVPEPEVEGAQGQAARPDVRLAEARQALVAARIQQVRREARPDASVVAAYGRTDAGFPQLGLTSTGSLERIRDVFHNVAVGMTWTFPVRNRNQGELEALEAERRAAEREREAVALAAESELAAARIRLRQAENALETYRTRVRGRAASNLDVFRQSYELGRTPLLDVVVEQRRFLDIERGYTDALLELYEARVDLAQALGRATP